MKSPLLALVFILLTAIKGAEEPSLEAFNKLNMIEMIDKNQSFIITSTESSIAFFDSLDRNSIVYISKDKEKFLTQMDDRITGKFYQIEPNEIYYVRIYLLSKDSIYYPSNLIKYLYPVGIAEQSISIKGSEINFLYLQKDKVYTLDFKENSISKRLIKLSRKTLDSEILIDNESKLNNGSLYYQLEENFKGELKLEVQGNDAFIEFLSSEEDYDILTNESLTNYELIKETNVILIEKTQKDFYIKLSSNKIFNYSFSYGFSNNRDYFYNNIKPCLSTNIQGDTYINTFELFVPFKDIILAEGEFLFFTVKIEKEQAQDIFIDYKQTSPISSLLDEKLEQSYCENIIKNLIEMFDLYIFTDIAKNPPNIEGIPNYHHRKIDIQKELSEVKTEGRFFYEFYQEVMSIIKTLKDLHLSLYAKYTPKGIPIIQYQIALPFNLYIKQEDLKLYIKINNVIKYYSQDFKDLLASCENVPLKTINNLEPFDFVQNFSKFKKTKNVHAQFTLTMNYVINIFNLYDSPFNYSDFAFFDYEFENNIMIRVFPHRFPDLVDAEFNSFYEEYIIKKEKENEIKSAYFSLPSFEEVKEKYFEYKGIITKKKALKTNKEKIDWNITINDPENVNKYIKCRIDEKNKVNVVSQNTFSLDFDLGFLKIIQCAELFHTNNYPIIIIESLNGGGNALLYMTMHQLFQARTVDRTYFSYRTTDISKKLKSGSLTGTNSKTCEILESFSDLKEMKDNYNYNGENIEHKRSEAFDIMHFSYRNILRHYREKFKNSQNLKRPTDIIIFTDTYSYSATSGLIKGFQNTGGAIIVGYYGNPKTKGIDLFDGSQSISSVESERIHKLDFYKNLEKLNFHIGGVTVGETFDDSIYGPNPIPREYAFDPVDERVDIYSIYNDDLYEEFIKQGIAIHNKYNNENYCNSRNEKLLFHIDNCPVKGKEHAYGGYRCKSDKNEWDTTECQAYYCDIGFYYNQYEQKCLEECSFNDTKSYLIIDDIKDKLFIIDENITTTFTFIIENSMDYYFYNSSKKLPYPKIGFIKTDRIFFYREKEAQNNFEFRISKITTDISFLLHEEKSFNENFIGFISKNETIIILQVSEDHIFYGNNIVNKKGNIIKYTKFNNQMKLNDILEGSDKYFKEYTKNDDFILFQKDETYILSFNYSSFTQLHYFLGPKNINENIDIIGNETIFLFLEKDKTYELDFKDNALDRLIKLSRKTLNSEIIIIDENIVLNSNNIYYQIKDGFRGKLKLEVTKSDAMIELLIKLNGFDFIFYENNKKVNLTNKFNYITAISEEQFSKRIIFNLHSDQNLKFKAFFGYAIPPYTYYSSGDLNDLSKYYQTNNSTFSFSPEKINLMNNEYFFVLIENLGNYLFLSTSEEDVIPDDPEDNTDEKTDNPDKKGDGNKGEEGLENWEISLIVVGSILFLIILLIIIFYFLRKNKRITNEKIEEKMENLNDIRG